MPPVIWHSLSLQQIIQETPVTNRYIFKVSEDTKLNHIPGQFLTCDLPIGEKRLQRWRSYSIANRNQGDREVEFCISYKKDGPASEYFFSKIQTGDQIKAKGPEGSFILPSQEGLDLILICTGTGLVPFRAMLQQIMLDGHHYKTIELIFGCRNPEDILYRSEWESWKNQIPKFHATICLSRTNEFPIADFPGIQFRNSYVHEAYLDLLNNNIISREHSLFMLCGWQEMIDEAIVKLYLEQRIPREKIKFELFG
ncbi:MAG: hypothetical protein IPM34_14215 [Saprospiraceae bacterium]|nr:hypothetical protein [Saprospiraceae bacterium]